MRVHAQTALSVRGDGARLKQVFWNLLSNAIKFTHAGGTVEVDLRARDGSAEVVVRDSGQGIDPKFLPHVFARFRQADASTTRKHGGLGIGLAIVASLVEAHDGTVRAESDGPGKGATFTVGPSARRAVDDRPFAPRTRLRHRREAHRLPHPRRR